MVCWRWLVLYKKLRLWLERGVARASCQIDVVHASGVFTPPDTSHYHNRGGYFDRGHMYEDKTKYLEPICTILHSTQKPEMLESFRPLEVETACGDRQHRVKIQTPS